MFILDVPPILVLNYNNIVSNLVVKQFSLLKTHPFIIIEATIDVVIGIFKHSICPTPRDMPFSFACMSFQGTMNRCDRPFTAVMVLSNCRVVCLIFHLY
jgi:hypothetical protein